VEQPLADLLPRFAADKNIALQVDQPWGRISWLVMNHAQPPFNDARIRRAAMMAVRQEDHMRATFGDDPSLWRVSKDVFPFGTPYYSGADGDAMRGDPTVAAKLLKEAVTPDRKSWSSTQPISRRSIRWVWSPPTR